MNKNKLVKKSNSLITARYELSLVEQKLVLTLISMVNQDDEDFHEYRFYIKDFFKLTDSDSEKNYTFIKNSFKSLLSKPLEIRLDDRNWLLCNWLSSAESNYNEGYVDVCFDPKLKPFLLKLKECFTTYQLKNILFLHSAYSVRIYEMLKQFESTGIKTISVDELKNILKVSPNFTIGNINQRILKPAQKELKEHTDISFTYDFIKHGRRFTDITFKVKRNTKIPKLLQEENGKPLTFEQLAETCYQKYQKTKKCDFKKDNKLNPPYCKLCANYSKKLEQPTVKSSKA